MAQPIESYTISCRTQDLARTVAPFALRIDAPRRNARGVYACSIDCEGLDGLPPVATGITPARCFDVATMAVRRRLVQAGRRLVDHAGAPLRLPDLLEPEFLDPDWEDLDPALNAELFRPLRSGPRPPLAPFSLSCRLENLEGRRRPFELAIGAPRREVQRTGSESFSAALTCGLFGPGAREVVGEDPVQAMALAFELVWQALLHGFERPMDARGRPVALPRYRAWTFGDPRARTRRERLTGSRR